MSTADDVMRYLEKLEGVLGELRDMSISGNQVTVYNGLSEIDTNLGLIRAGEFRAGNGKDPGSRFSGIRLGYPGFYYLGEWWHLVGVSQDKLMFGLRSNDGSALFSGGQGVIDDDGITLYGLLNGFSLQATSTDDALDTEYKRFGSVEMFLPEGSNIPSLALSYKDDTTGESLITNGDFDIGTLTGWTDSGSGFSAVEDTGINNAGVFALHRAETTSATVETLTSSAFTVKGNTKYVISLTTKDAYENVELEPSANLLLDQQNPAFSYANVASPIDQKSFLCVGYYLGNLEQRTLVDYDLSGLVVSNLYRAELRYYPKKIGNSIGTQTMNVYRVLRSWSHTEACWNYYTGTTGWTTAGCKGSGTDYSATNLGSEALTLAGVQESFRYLTLDLDSVQAMLDSPSSYHGFLLSPSTTSGNNAIELGMAEGSIGPALVLTECSNYRVVVSWYDGASGAGTLLREDIVARENGIIVWNARSMSLISPATALSATITVYGGRGREFSIDDILVKEFSVFSRVFFAPYLSIQDTLGTRRVLSVEQRLPIPSAPVVVRGGSSTYTIQPDGTSGVDSYIYDDSPTTNYGTSTTMNVGETTGGGQISRGVILFSLASLPSTAIVASATLVLYDTQDFASNAGTLYAYRLLRNWVESQVTWNQYSSGNNWGTAGGTGAADINATAIGSASVAASFAGSSVSVALDATTVQGWKSGSISNYGMLLKMGTETDNLHLWASSDNATASRRPKLVVVTNATDGVVDEGTHYYKVTYYDSAAETCASAAGSVENFSGDKSEVTITVGPPGTVGRKIYRTKVGDSSTYYLLATIADNTTTVYLDNTADASLGAEADFPVTNLTTDRPQFPLSANIFCDAFHCNVTNAYGTDSSNGLYREITSTYAAIGSYYEFSVWIGEGTFDLHLVCDTGTDKGTYKLYIDDIDTTENVDFYSGSSVAGALLSLSDSVSVSGNGYHKLRLQCTTKHASSSGYAIRLYRISLQSTQI